MLPNLGGLSLRCAPASTRAPAMGIAGGSRAHESTSGAPQSPKPAPKPKKQKVDPNEPSAEEKRAAYAARNAKAEHDERIREAEQALKEAEAAHFEVIEKLKLNLLEGVEDDELNAQVEAAEAKANELRAELKALKEAPAPVEVEPERMPHQTEAQKRIHDLQQKQANEGLAPEEQEELDELRGTLKKQRLDAKKDYHEYLALERARMKLENRRKALDDPKHWRKHLKGQGESQVSKGEEKWWETIGKHMAAQKAERAYEARLEALAAAMGRPAPPAPRPPPRRIAWRTSLVEPRDVVNDLNRQLEELGLLEVEQLKRAHAEREARLAPVRVQLKRNDEAEAEAAKEAAAQAARDAKAKKASKRSKDQAAQAASQKKAIAQDAQAAQARRAALARQDAEAHAARGASGSV